MPLVEDSEESDAMPASAASFRFLDLPGEVRNRIYHYCLFECDYDDSREEPAFRPSADDLTAIGIVQACKQTHTEAVPVLIAANTWRTTDLQKFRDNFLWPLGFSQIQLLKRLHTEVDIGKECLPLQRGDVLDDSEDGDGFSFSEKLVLDDYDDDDERLMPRSSHRELDSRHRRYALIVQRAVCNLVRLELLDQHQLETLVYQAKDTDGIYYNSWYTVSLTRTSCKKDAMGPTAAKAMDEDLAEQFERLGDDFSSLPVAPRCLECDGLDYDDPMDYILCHYYDIMPGCVEE